jgi:hypothetical protein
VTLYPFFYHAGDQSRVTADVTADGLIRLWQFLALAECAVDQPFRRPASLRLDQALVAFADLEERLR